MCGESILPKRGAQTSALPNGSALSHYRNIKPMQYVRGIEFGSVSPTMVEIGISDLPRLFGKTDGSFI